MIPPSRANKLLGVANALRASLGLLLVLLLTGCGSVQPNYYTLTPWPGTSQGGGPLVVEVQTPVVADYLSRDYIVLNNNGGRLHLAKDAAWAESLANAIGRNLALDLSQRLPGSTVFAENSGVAPKPKAIVALSVSRFAENDAGQAEIAAMVSIGRPGSAEPGIRSVHFATPSEDTSIGALAASLSRLLGQVADQAAKDLRALEAGRGKSAVAGASS